MITRIVLACCVAFVVFIVCSFVGGVLLVSLGVPVVVATGHFLDRWAGAFATVAGIWYFVSGQTFSWPSKP